MGSQTTGYTSLNEGLNLDRIDVPYAKIDWRDWPDTSNQEDYADDILAPGQVLRRPDVEDEGLICWGLAESRRQLMSAGAGANVDVLYGEGANLRMYLGAIKLGLLG